MTMRRRFVPALYLTPALLMGAVAYAQEAPPVEATVAPQVLVHPVSAKGKKNEYTGPTTIVELAPTPMLDEEGKQRMDPEGKLMFNAPVRQQRDKKGHPLFDEKGKPVYQTAKEMGYDEGGKKIHVEKEKPVKMTPVSIDHGVMTVDGYTGKAALNYDIADLKFIYLYAPGVGIAVVSNVAFPGATAQPGAFDDRTLTVTVDGHVMQVASEKRLLGKVPEPAFVLVDREFKLPSKFPVMGYGAVLKAPYVWPGAKASTQMAGVLDVAPMPKNILPVQLLKPCAAGYMRPAGPAPLPGEVAVDQPCRAIPKAAPVRVMATATRPAAPATASAAVSEK